MKRITFIIILASIFSFSFSQRQIKKVEVTEKGFDVKLTYNPIIDEISHEGLTFKFTPISPDLLNSLFMLENSYNGKFNYSFYEESREAYFLKRKREKTDLEFFIEGTEWLIENNKVNQQEYNELVKQIIYYFNEKEGEELYGQDKYTHANPYFIKDHFLSILKVDITNTTNVSQNFNDDITLESGNQILTPLNKEEVSHLLSLGNFHNTDKQQSLERNHFESSFSIPPYSKFTKYLAVLPFDYRNKFLELSIKGNNTKAKWEIEIDEKLINELYTYFEFDIEYSFEGASNYSSIDFNLLVNPHDYVYLNKDLLFIDQGNLVDEFEIVTLSQSSDKLYYNRITLKGADLVNLEKFRRSTLEVDLIKIDELKKKVRM